MGKVWGASRRARACVRGCFPAYEEVCARARVCVCERERASACACVCGWLPRANAASVARIPRVSQSLYRGIVHQSLNCSSMHQPRHHDAMMSCIFGHHYVMHQLLRHEHHAPVLAATLPRPISQPLTNTTCNAHVHESDCIGQGLVGGLHCRTARSNTWSLARKPHEGTHTHARTHTRKNRGASACISARTHA